MFKQIDRQHLPWPKPALGDDALLGHIPQACFGGDDQMAIIALRPARRAQAVAIQRAHGMPRIAHDEARRTIPGFGVQGVVLVERLQVLIEVFIRAPGRWHEDARCREQVDATFDQQFEHVVEALRIRTAATDVVADVGNVEQGRVQLGLARERPVAVGADGVDFAVVGEHAEGLGEIPVRRGVGRKALVKGHCRAFKFGAHEIRKDIAQLPRRGHGLVADRGRGERDDIEAAIVSQGQFAAPACAEQGAIECRLVHAIGGIDEDLADARPARATERATRCIAYRHIAPAGRCEAFLAQAAFKLLRRSVGLGGIVVEKNQAGGEACRRQDAGFAGECAQPGLGAVDEDAAAITGDAIGIDAATMRHLRERGKRLIDKPGAGFAVDVGNQAKAATVVFESGIVKSGSLQRCH